jgi:prepilin-type N-terminal cleavage/methylation domain-containing protein/prepilin-type processing-associated H-X9-DG protein
MNPTRRSTFVKACEDGFTFVELLVVMATVGILAVLLLPAIAGTKPDSQALQCLENQRQMALAWLMYAEDNGGKAAPNYPQGTSPNGPATSLLSSQSAYACWVAGVETSTSGPENTNTAMLVDHVQYPNGAFLGPYLNKNYAIFKCPADKSAALIFGVRRSRVRSVSMNNFLGSPALALISGGPSAYATYPQTSSLKSAALTFVFLDEREDSINDGTFLTGADNPNNIIDVPASHHNGAASFSFADGHSEMHQWTSAKLKSPLQTFPINNLNVSGDPAGLQDSYWLCQHALGLGSFP